MTLAERVVELGRPLRDQPIRRATLTFAVSELGDGAAWVVVPLVVYRSSGSLSLVAAMFALELFAGTIGAAVGGALADRFDRRRVILTSYAMRLVLLLAMVWLVDRINWFIALGVLAQAIGRADNPSAEAILRALARDRLEATIILRRLLQNVAGLVGPAVGAVLLTALNPASALLFDVGTFAVAMGMLVSTQVTALPNGQGLVLAANPVTDASVVRDVARDAALRPVMLSTFLSNFAVSATVVSAVEYLDRVGGPAGAYGWSLAAYAAGAMLGLILAGLVQWEIDLDRLIRRSLAAYGVIAAAGIMVGTWWAIAVSWLVWGVAYGPEQVVSDATVSRRTADHRLGRVYAAWSVVTQWSSGVGYLAVLLAGDLVPGRALMLAAALLLVGPAPLVVRLACRRGRRTGAA